jgi:hypothetical protein
MFLQVLCKVALFFWLLALVGVQHITFVFCFYFFTLLLFRPAILFISFHLKVSEFR